MIHQRLHQKVIVIMIVITMKQISMNRKEVVLVIVCIVVIVVIVVGVPMTVVTAAIHVATLTVAAKKGGECNCEVMHHSLRQLQSRWYRQYHVHHSSTKTKNKKRRQLLSFS